METLHKVSLFWDVDTDTLDPQTHRKFIIERILARGDLDDFAWARGFYGSEALKKTLMESRSLDPKSLSFWCLYFSLPTDVCTPKPSLLRQNAFWKRSPRKA
jgi:hypothetical protein